MMTLLRIVLALVLPPLAVFFTVGLKGHFWLNIVLTILGWIPGVIHAGYVIGSRHERRREARVYRETVHVRNSR